MLHHLKNILRLAKKKSRSARSKKSFQLQVSQLEERIVFAAPVAVDDLNYLVPAGVTTVVPVLNNDTITSNLINPASLATSVNPVHGSLVISSGAFRYTPAPAYTGPDTFKYTVKDTAGVISNVATVTLNVTTNQAPTAVNDTVNAHINEPAFINPLANDADPVGSIDATTETITQNPSHGTLVKNATSGKITYTPTSNYVGPDSFKYTVKDNSGVVSNVATVNINVAANVGPTAVNDSYTVMNTISNNVLKILENDSDADRSIAASTTATATTIQIVTNPSHGTLFIDSYNGYVTYRPSSSVYTGPDSFAYTVKDNNGAVSNSATVSLTITASNTAPVAVDDSYAAFAGTPSLFKVTMNDTDTTGTINPTTLVFTQLPTHGTVIKNASTGEVQYTPNAGYTGPDSFKYTVADSFGLASNAATVTLSVTPQATYVYTSPTSRGLLPPGMTTIGGIVLDMIGTNGVRIVSQLPSSSLYNGFFNSGTPSAYSGNWGIIGIQQGFTPAIINSLGGGLSELAVRMTISDGDTGVFDFDEDVNYLGINGVNIGNFSNVVTQQTNATGLAIISTNPSGGFRDSTLDTGFFYVTNPALLSRFYNSLSTGDVVFQYMDQTSTNRYGNTFDFTQGVDGGALSVGALPNVAPIAQNDTAQTRLTAPVIIDVLQNDSDSDGAVIPGTLAIVTPPAHGSASIDPVTHKVTYTASAAYSGGPDSFTYTVKDNSGALSNVATVNITVLPNQLPIAVNDSASTLKKQSVLIDLDYNDSDPDGTVDPSKIQIVTSPLHGSVNVDATGLAQYTPSPTYVGPDSFTYTIKDNDGGVSNLATVSIDVKPLPNVNDVLVHFGKSSYSLIGNNKNLPWININQIDIVFSEDVVVQKEDLALSGINVNNYNFSGFSYDNLSHKASWFLASTLTADRLFMSLDGDNATSDGNIGVANPAGVYLENGDFNLNFNVLPGDVNNDGVVTTQDAVAVKNHMPQYGSYDLFYDLDGDNDVDLSDYNAVTARLKKTLPNVQP